MLTAQFISVGFRSAKPGNVQTFIGTPGKRLDEFGTYENFAKAFESQQNGMAAGMAAEGVDESERTE